MAEQINAQRIQRPSVKVQLTPHFTSLARLCVEDSWALYDLANRLESQAEGVESSEIFQLLERIEASDRAMKSIVSKAQSFVLYQQRRADENRPAAPEPRSTRRTTRSRE